jgi:drug/metabolite transporter (DMT)-like permease
VIKIVTLTALALIAFAFNSILCRLALRTGEADPAGFTVVRLISGAIMLMGISFFARGGGKVSSVATGLRSRGSWISAVWIFVYAICFSLAYVNLTTGTGALVLFGSVQLSIVLISFLRGNRPGNLEWVGMVVASAGLVYLVLPGLSSPPLVSCLLMAAAGSAWGLYTLRGKGSSDPLADTTGNFVRSVPFAIVLALVSIPNFRHTNYGLVLAILSGAVTSGVGYTIWYAVLKHHTPARAAVLQLLVPVIAAVTGVVFMAEAFTYRLGIAAALILSGIAIMPFSKW